METTYRRSRASEIIRYGFGGVGSNTAYMLTMVWLTFFYTDIFGINPLVISGLMLVTRIIDAVTDPLMGMIGDRTRSKWGRYRPYVMFGAPILGITVFLLFSAPALSPTMKIVYAYCTYIFYSLISTMVNIPYHSLTPVMTEDPDQRTVVVVTKQAGGILASVFVSTLALPLVGAFGGGQTGWSMYGAFCGILVTLSFLICAWGAKNADKPEYMPKKVKLSFAHQLQVIYKNRPLLMLLIAFGTDQIALAAASSVNMYYFTYFLGRPDLIAIMSLIAIPFQILIMACIPFLVKKFDKRPVYLFFTALSLIPLTVLFFQPPENVTFIVVLSLLSTMINYVPGVLGWGMLPDCAEYAYWKTGIRAEGTVSASLTFINKCGMAIGGALTGVFLAWGGYVAGAVQTAEALTMIRTMKFIFPLVGYICSLFSMYFYNITKKTYAQMVSEIKQREGMADH